MALIHPDDRQRSAPAAELVQDGGVQALDYRIVRPDGEVRHVTARRYGRFGAHGEVTHLVGTVQDVTELREVERARFEAQEGFARAFDDAPVGIAMVALDGGFIRANRALCETLRYAADQLEALSSLDQRAASDRGGAGRQRAAL